MALDPSTQTASLSHCDVACVAPGGLAVETCVLGTQSETVSFPCGFLNPLPRGQWDSFVDLKAEPWQNSPGISWLQSHMGFTFHSVPHSTDFSWCVLHPRCRLFGLL